MLHKAPDDDPFTARLQRAALRQLAGSEAEARAFAENYVGLPLTGGPNDSP
jgi:p-hydroxybenzoate 3-monooxygenase